MEFVSSFVGLGISYTRGAGICLVVRRVKSLLHTRVLESVWSFGGWRVSVTCHVLSSVWPFVGWGVSVTRYVLNSVWSFVGWGCLLYTSDAADD